MGSHNQLCSFYTLINWLVTNSFYIHAWNQMNAATRHIKMGCCKMCQGQLVTRSVTWHQHRATRSVKECSWRFLRRPKTEKLQTVGEVYIWSIRTIFLKLHEASWTVRKVVLRTGLSGFWIGTPEVSNSIDTATPLSRHTWTRLQYATGELNIWACANNLSQKWDTLSWK